MRKTFKLQVICFYKLFNCEETCTCHQRLYFSLLLFVCYVSYVMVFKREKEVVSFFVCFLCLSNSSYHTISTVLKVWPETKTFSMNNTIKIFHNKT